MVSSRRSAACSVVWTSRPDFTKGADRGVSTVPGWSATQIAVGHAAVARAGCSVFPLVDKANDEPTADPLMQRLAVRGQTAWILLSLLK